MEKQNKDDRIEELQNQLIRQKENLEYIESFIYGINHNCFDRMFLRELFNHNGLIDTNKATRDIMHFIVTNRRRWGRRTA